MKYVALVAALLLLSGCATARRHPTATKLAFVGIGIAVGAAVAVGTSRECDRYPAGYSGVNVNCSKEVK